MFRARRPVMRAVATTAVVAGTAGAVHHAQEKRWANKQAEQDAAAQQSYQQGVSDAQAQQQYAPPPQQQYYAPPPPAPAPANDLNSQLQQLAQLHNAGVLNDEEFSAAKQKLLSS